MRWVGAPLAVALALSACAPLLPAASPSPSPAPTPIARGTPRPALTARPPATATPVRTPRPSASPIATAPRVVPTNETPRPLVGPPVENALCSPWPDDASVVTVMTQLALPPSLCLLRTTTASVGKIVCTVVGCVPVTSACANAGSCVEVVAGEKNPHYVLVYVAPPSLAPAITEGYAVTRHLCKLHQERTLIDARLRGRSWLATLEGGEFQSAFAFFRSAYPVEASSWGIDLSDVENYADVCAAWYYPSARDQRVGAFAPLLQFAQKWLPR